jgi:two-component system, chemotaxis family, chemotaxis protein CheY
MRVLIADDQKDVGRALAELVRICNHQVVAVVASGLEAIQAYAQHQPDLVLMDYRMPKLNGATACRNILSKDPAARIILVTAWSPSDDSSKSGAIAILPKPVALDRLDALLKVVAQTLPAPAPPEISIHEFHDVLSPSFDIVSPSLETSFPVEAPQNFQPDPIDIFQPVVESLPVVSPSFETNFPVEAPQDHFEQPAEACALPEKKISGKRRNNRRSAQRARVR